MLLEVLFTALSIIVAIPVFIFSLEITLALLAPKKVASNNEVVISRVDIAVLIPAYDEEKVISETLNRILPQLKSTDKLLVVADNCSDKTADISKQLGAQVLERNDLNLKGKGFALAYGVRYLSKFPPDVVVIIDADSIVDIGLIERIASVSFTEDRPVQALYLMKNTSPIPSLMQRLAEFAWRIKNYARPLGLNVVGLPCQLMGSGMAIPYNRLANINLANSNLVEDMKLGIDLAATGSPPLFCADAQLTSDFPDSTQASEGQRVRWEHGHMSMIINQVPNMLLKSIVNSNYMLLALVLDMTVPPLTLLAMFVFLMFGATGILYLLAGIETAFYLSIMTLLLFVITVCISWLSFGRDILSLRDVLVLPIQMLRKIPLYLRFVVNRQKKWEKTERD